ncbi:hypothetical protein FKR81_36265 [Lentzea tibetensis]|uniref:WXG100 family type VII secretion target n=1 Tax=Lentzea tibetensis TaxID=2591470 RepID=A0A563EI89_9PSEU|nr:hypothetical protein [Lentzea tibetensis]TWP46395.1 hypothetical protein FKR81_36265 [Lentzea tibetensis]
MSGRQIAAEHGAQLDFLSRLSRRVGVADLVEEYFDPAVGDWNDLHEEAERWRKAARVTETVTKHVSGPLGSVDAAWQGRDADSFVEHMRSVGLAGGDMSDAMNAMADALEETADTVRDIVRDMAGVLSDAADSVSGAAALPLDGDQAVVRHLEELRPPVRELFESVRDVLEAFLKLCDGLSGEDGGFGAVSMKHRYPEQNWSYTAPAASKVAEKGPEKPAEAPKTVAAGAGGGGGVSGGGGSISSALGGGGSSAPEPPMQPGGSTAVQEPAPAEPAARPAAAAAGAPAGGSGAGAGGGMMGGMAPMMGGGMGQQQGGDKEHKRKQQLTGSVDDLLGKPKKASPKVIGED